MEKSKSIILILILLVSFNSFAESSYFIRLNENLTKSINIVSNIAAPVITLEWGIPIHSGDRYGSNITECKNNAINAGFPSGNEKFGECEIEGEQHKYSKTWSYTSANASCSVRLFAQNCNIKK